MYVTTPTRKGNITVVRLVHGYRKDGKVKIKTIKTLGQSRDPKKWDGIFGLCTNIQNQTAKELFSSYKRLWKIEESFRINKHTLKMRPIFHQLSKRIKAHILICFLTYTLLRYLELFLKNKGLPLSHKTLIDTLSSAQSHVSEDAQTGWEFATPQGLSQEGKQIYKAFGITRPTKPYFWSKNPDLRLDLLIVFYAECQRKYPNNFIYLQLNLIPTHEDGVSNI